MAPTSDVDAIGRLMIAYVGAMDRRQWAVFDEIFVPGIVAEYGEHLRFDRRDALASGLRAIIESCGRTHHLLGNFVVDAQGDAADGSCYLQAFHTAGDGSDLTYEVLGCYIFHAVRVEGSWRLDRLAEETWIERGSQAVFGTVPTQPGPG